MAQLNLSNLSGEEGGPCPRSSLKAIQHQSKSLTKTNPEFMVTLLGLKGYRGELLIVA
jgi:hypothetical protein